MIAKGLGGGYQPIGGILIAGRIVDALANGTGGFLHGQTYQAHPVACAAALAVQHVIRDDGLLDNVRAMGTRLEAALIERFGNHRHIGDIRGRGLFWAIVTTVNRDDVVAAALERDLWVYPAGSGPVPNAVMLAPPFVITEDETVELVARLRAAFDAVAAA